MEEKFSIQPYLTDTQILQQTADQIKKDFAFFSLPVNFSGNKATAYAELFDQVFPHLKELMDKDYERFCSLMYRVDVNEAQVKAAEVANKSAEPAKIIADLIIKRCLQKVVLRKLFSKNE